MTGNLLNLLKNVHSLPQISLQIKHYHQPKLMPKFSSKDVIIIIRTTPEQSTQYTDLYLYLI